MQKTKSRRSNQILAAAVGAVGVMGVASAAQAATYWFGTGVEDWNATASWSTTATANSPNPSLLPGTTDTVIFGVDAGIATGTSPRLNANQSVYGMVNRNTNSLKLWANANGGTTPYTLTLGSGGLTMATGAKLQVLGASTRGPITVALGTNQVWRNFNADVVGVSHNLSLGVQEDGANADIDLKGSALTVAGQGGLQVGGSSSTSPSTKGRIIDSVGGGSIALGANAVLRLANRSNGNNTDRIVRYGASDEIDITSYGGTVDFYTASVGSVNYNETVGTLTLAKGALNHSQLQAGSGSTSTFTYSGLTRTGQTSTVLFAGTGLGATGDARNRLLIGGQSSTTFMGGWAAVDGFGFASYDTATSSGYARGVYANTGSTLTTTTSDASSVYNIYDNGVTAAAHLTVGALVSTGNGGRTLTLGTYNLTIDSGGLLFDNDSNAHSITGTTGKIFAGDSSTNNANLYVTVATAANQAGAKTISALIADKTSGGKLTLVKSGVGTLTLTSTNTYSGDTVINAGKLNLSTAGSIASSGTIEVLYGATLDVNSQTSTWTLGSAQTLKGNGTVTGNVNVSGKVAAGSSAGTLSITGNVTFADNSVLEVEAKNTSLAGDKWESGYDQLVVTGTVNLGSYAKLDVSLLPSDSLNTGDRLFIISNDDIDAVSGKFKTMGGTVLNQEDTFTDGKQFKIYYAADFASGALTGGNDVALEVVVPEPSSAASLLATGALMALRRKKRS